VTDLSERKQVEEALRRERDFSAAVLDTIDALVVVLDREGHIVRFNRGCERLTRYTQDEVRGKPFWEIFLPPEDVPTITELFRSLTGGIAPQYGNNVWITKDGEQRWIAWSNTVLREANESVEYVIATGIDMTGQKQMEAALRRQG
jgi:PAS domain S-box-containing protein